MNEFNIKVEGRGMWFMIHTLALHATTDSQKLSFQVMMEQLSAHLGCNECQTHLKYYMTQFPIRAYWRNNQLFKWSWELHNHVNQKLGKRLFSFDESLNMYKNFVCHNCDQVSPPAILVAVDKSTEDVLNLLSFY